MIDQEFMAELLAMYLAKMGAKEVVFNVHKEGTHHRITVLYETVGPSTE